MDITTIANALVDNIAVDSLKLIPFAVLVVLAALARKKNAEARHEIEMRKSHFGR